MLQRLLTRLAPVRLELALALLVLGARLWVLWYAGSPLPYYDQWVAEFHNTFLRIVNGSSLWQVLFLRHNEHILVTTKLLTLAGFTLNGYWDVFFLAVCAAVTRAAEAVLLFRLFSWNGSDRSRLIAWTACVAVFVAPTSGYNLLCGLQICFALAELALIAAVFSVLRWSRPLSSGAGLLLASVLGLISLGSAIAIPFATLVVHLTDRRPRPGFWTAWGGTIVATGFYMQGIPLGAGSVTGAGGWADRLRFFLTLTGWPTGSVLLGTVIVVAVAAVTLRRIVATRETSNGTAGLLGIATFAFANAAILAINRAPADFHLRHWDSIALIPLTVLVLFANRAFLAPRRSTPAQWVVGFLAAGYLTAFAVAVWQPNAIYLRDARAHRADALAYHRGLLMSSRLVDEATGVSTTLDRSGSTFFDDPILRFTPHRGVYTAIARAPLKALSLLSPDVVPLRPPSVVSRLTQFVIRFGGWLAVPGLLLAASALAGRRKPASEATPLAA